MTALSPQLRFRLSGEWLGVDTRDLEAARTRAREIAREVTGGADDAVILRRRFEGALIETVDAAHDASADALLICREIAPGVSAPVSLTVHSAAGMGVTPAVGVDPARVMAAFEAALPAAGEPNLESAERLRIPGSEILRLHAVTPQTIEEGQDAIVHNRLVARYWYTVPGEKRVILVNLTTPLGDIPHVMLRLFDAIVGASYWADAAHG